MEAQVSTVAEGMPVRPQPDGSDIVKVGEGQIREVAQALAKAFYDDPIMSWIFPDDARRMERLVNGFELYVRRVWLPHDESYTTDRVAGVCCWMPPPDAWHMSIPAQLRLLPAMARMAGRDLPRLMKTLNAMESAHPREPHFYLPMIGVDPQWQGKGFGAALMRPVLERCDREESSAYLEATTPRNRALYERNGFEFIEELKVAKDAPPMWRMWRKPQSTG